MNRPVEFYSDIIIIIVIMMMIVINRRILHRNVSDIFVVSDRRDS